METIRSSNFSAHKVKSKSEDLNQCFCRAGKRAQAKFRSLFRLMTTTLTLVALVGRPNLAAFLYTLAISLFLGTPAVPGEAVRYACTLFFEWLRPGPAAEQFSEKSY